MADVSNTTDKPKKKKSGGKVAAPEPTSPKFSPRQRSGKIVCGHRISDNHVICAGCRERGVYENTKNCCQADPCDICSSWGPDRWKQARRNKTKRDTRLRSRSCSSDAPRSAEASTVFTSNPIMSDPAVSLVEDADCATQLEEDLIIDESPSFKQPVKLHLFNDLPDDMTYYDYHSPDRHSRNYLIDDDYFRVDLSPQEHNQLLAEPALSSKTCVSGITRLTNTTDVPVARFAISSYKDCYT